MDRYIIQTLITCKNKQFQNKIEMKAWFEKNLVPQDVDDLRRYNLNIMNKYGHENFFLTFIPPNIGILTHIYQTIDEYKNSIPLRQSQKEMIETHNIDYTISDLLVQELK